MSGWVFWRMMLSGGAGEEKKEETGERSDGGREEEGAAESGAVKTPAADKVRLSSGALVTFAPRLVGGERGPALSEGQALLQETN